MSNNDKRPVIRVASRIPGLATFIASQIIFVLAIRSGGLPLPPPEFVRVTSRNFKSFAESDPKTNQTVVYRDNGGSPGEILWKFPRWFRSFRISKDGEVIVAENDYLNLLPPKIAQDDYILLTFISRGKVFREITVKQLLGSRSKLQPAGSDLTWGRGLYDIDENGLVLLDTVDGFFVFDVHTAKCVFPQNNNVDVAQSQP